MNKTTKIFGKIILVALIVGAIGTGTSLLLIYGNVSHTWDQLTGLLGFFGFGLAVVLLIPFLVMFIIDMVKKK